MKATGYQQNVGSQRRRPRTPKFQKKVSFALNQNEVREVAHINDLKLDTDITMFWYTDEEFDRMTKECNDIVICRVDLLMRQQQPTMVDGSEEDDYDSDDDDNDNDESSELDEEASCIRGLEAMIEYEMERRDPECLSPRQCRKEAAWDAVLEEQDMQLMEGEYNDELLADVYYHFSQDSQMKAELVGLDDWKTALLLED